MKTIKIPFTLRQTDEWHFVDAFQRYEWGIKLTRGNYYGTDIYVVEVPTLSTMALFIFYLGSIGWRMEKLPKSKSVRIDGRKRKVIEAHYKSRESH